MSQITKQQKKAETKQVMACTFTLTNTVMGAALLSLPEVFMRLGWVLGTVAMIIAALFESVAFIAIVKASHYSESRTLRGMMAKIFGNGFAYVLDVTVCFIYIGFLICYVSVFADYIQAFIIQLGGDKFNVIWLKLIVVPVLIGMSLFKSPDALSKASAFAVLFICVAVIAVVIFFFIFLIRGETETTSVLDRTVTEVVPFPNPLDTIWPANKNPGFAFLEVIQLIPMFMPLYGAQPSLPVLLQDIEGPPNMRRRIMEKAGVCTIIVSSILYYLTALLGCMMFGKNVASNVLLSFSPTNVTMTIVRLLYAFVVILSYAVIIYPVRSMVIEWFKIDAQTRSGKIWFQLIGLIVIAGTVALSIAVPNISVVLNIVSSLFGIAAYWVIPVLAIWILPLLKAESYVPVTDEINDIEEASTEVRRRSLSTKSIQQQTGIGNNQQQEEQSVCYSSYKNGYVKLDQESSNQHENNLLKSSKLNKTEFDTEQKKKNFNDLTGTSFDLQNNEYTIPIDERTPLTPKDLQQKALLSNSNVFTQEERDAFNAQMTTGRKVGQIITNCFIIALNLTAFILSTFFNMSSDKYNQ